jgi:hypothetical protein
MDLLFIAIVLSGILMGVLLTILVYTLRGDKFTGRSGIISQVEEPDKQAHGPSSSHEGIESVRIVRQHVRPGLIIEMDGLVFYSPQELDDNLRQRLSGVYEELSTWIADKDTYNLPVGGTKPAEDNDSGLDRSPLPQEREATKPITVDFLSTPPLFGSRLKSLAEQVDEILQEKIAANPDETPPIRLVDSVLGGLVVEVGTDRYEGIDAVPDEGIRQVIREAVREWEKRSKFS